MSEKDFVSEDLRDFLYDPYGAGAEKGKSLQDNGKISSATRTILNDAYIMYQLDEKFLQTLDDFLSTNSSSAFKAKFNEINSLINDKVESLIKNEIDSLKKRGLLTEENEEKIKIKGQSQKQTLLLGTLLIKLDLLERANYQDHKIYNDVKNSIDSTFNSIFNNCNYDEIQRLVEDSLFSRYISSSLRQEGEPSQYFVKSFLKKYKDKFKTLPKIGDFGSIYCVLLVGNQTADNLEFLEHIMDPEDLIAYSSNQGKKLPKKENRKSTLFEERATGTEDTLIARGNLNYMSELFRLKYKIEKDYKEGRISKEKFERYNSHFYKMIGRLTDYAWENRNYPNKEVIPIYDSSAGKDILIIQNEEDKIKAIKEINYTLNCPVYIDSDYCTTMADYVENELKFNKELSDSERAVLIRFAKVMGIEKDPGLNIPGLKLMNAKEAKVKCKEAIENDLKSGDIKGIKNRYSATVEDDLKIMGAKVVAEKLTMQKENEFTQSPESKLEIYGFNSLDQEDLRKIVIDEKKLEILMERKDLFKPYKKDDDVPDLTNITLTPLAFKNYENNRDPKKLKLAAIKMETKEQKINEECFNIMVSRGFPDFTGAIFDGKFSLENKKKILEKIEFNKTIENISKDTTDFKQIESNVDNVLSFVKECGLGNILHKSAVRELEKFKKGLTKYNSNKNDKSEREKKVIAENLEKLNNMDWVSGKIQKNTINLPQ